MAAYAVKSVASDGRGVRYVVRAKPKNCMVAPLVWVPEKGNKTIDLASATPTALTNIYDQNKNKKRNCSYTNSGLRITKLHDIKAVHGGKMWI